MVRATLIELGTKFLRVLIFAIFPAIRKNKFPQIKITANPDFSRKNLHQSKYSLTLIRYTKIKYYEIVFNHNLSLSFRNKTVYNEIMVNPLHVLNKNENIISAGYWVLWKFWKSQTLILTKKNQSVLIGKLVPAKHKKIANPQK